MLKKKKDQGIMENKFFTNFQVLWMLGKVSRSLLTTARQMNYKKADRSVPLVSTQSYSEPVREYKNKTHDQDQTKTTATDVSLNDQFMQ